MPKTVDHDERRRSLIEATWQVIAREGIAGATARGIAREAGCSSGGLAHHLPGEADLAAGVVVLDAPELVREHCACGQVNRPASSAATVAGSRSTRVTASTSTAEAVREVTRNAAMTSSTAHSLTAVSASGRAAREAAAAAPSSSSERSTRSAGRRRAEAASSRTLTAACRAAARSTPAARSRQRAPAQQPAQSGDRFLGSAGSLGSGPLRPQDGQVRGTYVRAEVPDLEHRRRGDRFDPRHRPQRQTVVTT